MAHNVMLNMNIFNEMYALLQLTTLRP